MYNSAWESQGCPEISGTPKTLDLSLSLGLGIPGMSWGIWDSEDLGSLALSLGLGMSWDIPDSEDLESLCVQFVLGIPGMSLDIWDSEDLGSFMHPITRPGNPRDALGYMGLQRLRICHPFTWPGNPRDILVYPGLRGLGISHTTTWPGMSSGGLRIWNLLPYHSAWESQGCLSK